MISEKKHFLFIDALKGLGAFIIAFVWHYQHFEAVFPIERVFSVSLEYGYLFVELFFALSGFGIAFGYQERLLKREIKWDVFLKKRLSKIYPTHLLTLMSVTFLQCFYVVLFGNFFIYQNFDLYHFVLNLFLIQNGFLGTEWSFNAPSWCLSVFVFCYGLFFVIVYSSRCVRDVIFKSLIAVFLAEYLVDNMFTGPILNSQIGRGLACFSLGVLLYNVWLKRRALNTQLIGLLSVVVLLACYIIVRMDSAVVGNVPHFFVFGCTPLIILGGCFNKGIDYILDNRIFLFLGRISLNIYLWHFPVQVAMKCVDKIFSLNVKYESIYVWLFYVAVTIGVSSLDKFVLSEKCRKILLAIIRK